ncbi:hypothetical protein [Asticcacaulis sp. EMRT-3]|uniref:hypothetical protein n=1 Tax=Asticcacaulis sp. EMRT-3 TaxID=3040349 RepID=UPI0024AE8ED5|nr:hypothetical protein [Asticcacaulis sp. EMRT-3]MDI7774258.1 hypothetical protein [Asticcacaulis sp. EMRT-3]
MAHAARVLLYFLFGGIGLTLIASGLMWWFEASRRLARALNAALGKPADAIVYDLDGRKAAGLDFTAGDLAVMWSPSGQGLVFAFDEIEGAELIVDERVVARAQRGESRKVLNETHAQAAHVTLRLIFADVQNPEFEINLFGDVSHNPVHAKTAAEAVRLGRKWLSHVDAVIKRQSAQPSPYPEAEPVVAARQTERHGDRPQAPAPLPPWEDDDAHDTYDDEMR